MNSKYHSSRDEKEVENCTIYQTCSKTMTNKSAQKGTQIAQKELFFFFVWNQGIHGNENL